MHFSKTAFEFGNFKITYDDQFGRVITEQEGIKTFDSAHVLTPGNFHEIMGVEYKKNLFPNDQELNLGANFLDAIQHGKYVTANPVLLKMIAFPARDCAHYIEIPENFIVEGELRGGFIGISQGRVKIKGEGCGVLTLLCAYDEKLVKYAGDGIPKKVTQLSATTATNSSTAFPASSASTSTTSSSATSTTGASNTSTANPPNASAPTLLDHIQNVVTSMARPFLPGLKEKGIAVPGFAKVLLPELMTPLAPIVTKHAHYRATTGLNETADVSRIANLRHKVFVDPYQLSIQLFGEAIRSEKLKLNDATLDQLQSLSGPEACYQRGMMYLDGKGLKTDGKLAFKELVEATTFGHVNAFYQLGMMYLEGTHVEKNEKKALELLELAAKAGHWGAMFQRALHCYQSADLATKEKGKSYFMEAIKYARTKERENIFNVLREKKLLTGELAYALGNACPLSSLVRYGDVITCVDIGDKVKYWKAASDLQHSGASLNLAKIYQGTFKLTTPDMGRSLEASAMIGMSVPTEMFSIYSEKSSQYLQLSVGQRDELVMKYLALAKKQGHPDAQRELEKHFKSKGSDGVEVNKLRGEANQFSVNQTGANSSSN